MSAPRCLTIAGSDPSGGAGLQADLKTFHAHQGYGMAVVTALTAQNTRSVRAVHAPPAEFVTAQLAAVMEDCPPHGVKTGMLYSAEIVLAVAAELTAHPRAPLVVDPVMVATSGDRLLEADAEQAVRERLLGLATLVTPNRAEAGVLSGVDVVDDDTAVAAAERILSLGCAAVLVTGGDAGGSESVDLLVTTNGGCERLTARRVDCGPGHGTGCTLSAAIAARLAHGAQLREAVVGAKDFVSRALAAAVAVGAGAVPANHLTPGFTS